MHYCLDAMKHTGQFDSSHMMQRDQFQVYSKTLQESSEKQLVIISTQCFHFEA